ncbi:MAG: hypothetical protein A3C90_01840 [Candidatus Magasanikbacteria bacterium RIFCSPHIGHO2_02_FULL_51_14]|uniref:RNA polymerase subunit sigma-24 n=1 Tax=Candidatus Magasanikbacteria bacterium RIFCSPHIGHO2_02_FULL_51_14 TaxID=1798683 RepID=A0A1F6MG87_9BACT|nr:MAG: hypothetical protein A3C90_01840 [Candidatus Magasanikbacteria bacterium RIFCSPHIGHO2_02_FULL_51_14]
MAEKETFLSYYGRYRDKIYTYFLYRVSFQRELSEDLTSDVFLKAFDAFDSFDANRSFQAWIYTIARNHLINFYHKQAKQKTVALEDVKDTLLAGAHEDDSRKIDRTLEFERVMERIDTLPEEHQELIVLRYMNELSYKEIADITGKEEGALRVAVSRILQTLKETYE